MEVFKRNFVRSKNLDIENICATYAGVNIVVFFCLFLCIIRLLLRPAYFDGDF